jgi:WD40 repeat protein
MLTTKWQRRDHMTSLNRRRFLCDAGVAVGALAFGRMPTLAAAAPNDPRVACWELPHPSKPVFMDCAVREIASLAFSPDDQTLALSSGTKVQLMDVRRRCRRTSFNGHPDYVLSLAFAPDGRSLATTSREGTLKCWDLHTDRVTMPHPFAS